MGSSIVTMPRDCEDTVREVLRRLRLEHQVLANDSTLMILPPEVDKASGVSAALRELGLSAHNLVAIGDAPNDLALFRLAEHGVAVANADPSLKALASRITQAEYCDGFVEIADQIMQDDLISAEPRHRLLLGRDAAGEELVLRPFQDSLLMVDPTGSGMRALCRAMLDRLSALNYQCCVVAAEMNEHSTLKRGLASCGTAHEVPRLTDVMQVMEQPDVGVFVNVASLSVDGRIAFTEALLLQLQALHDRAGRPHAIFVLDAHAQFPMGTVPEATGRLSETTLIYTTSAEMLPGGVLAGFRNIIQIGDVRRKASREFAHAVPITLSDLPDLPAIWLSRASAAGPPQAMIGGRASVAACASLEVTESEASGY